MSVVAITQHQDIEQAISQAFTLLDLSALCTGKLVAVKPNETWTSAADCTGVTQPDTLCAVIRRIKAWSPRELIVRGGAGAAETDDVFRIAGLMAVVEEDGVRFFRSQPTAVHLGASRLWPVQRGGRAATRGDGQPSGAELCMTRS